jgi:hypothetical protein
VSEATELLERMEQAAHGGHGDGHGHGHVKGGPGKAIGITMAVLGVMLAFCAALVGSQRTELIETMVQQATKWGVYQAESTKFRVIEADAEILHAITPSKAEVDKFEHALKDVRAHSGKSDEEDTAELKDAIDVSTRELADILTPDKEDSDRFAALRLSYKHDMAEAKEDAEAYEGAIRAHEDAAEWYERAQLCAEIGIVVASIALLLGSRAVWSVSVVFGTVGAILVGMTYMRTSEQLAAAEKRIADAANTVTAIENDDADGDGRADTPPNPAATHEKAAGTRATTPETPPPSSKGEPAK